MTEAELALKLNIMKSINTKQRLHPIVKFDLPKGLILSYYREVFNAWSQSESKLLIWFLRLSDFLERLLKKMNQPQRQFLQLIPIDPNQKNKLVNANQIEKYGYR